MDKGPYKNVAMPRNGLLLRKRRLDAGLTQDDAAEKLGVGPNTVSRYETGERDPSIAMLRKMAELYDCAIGALFESGDGLSDEEREMIEYMRTNKRDQSVILSTYRSLRANAAQAPGS